MGTRGLFGFVVDGQEKLTYNHFDSYPDGKGVEVLAWLRTLTGPKLAEARDKAKALVLVNEDEKPTPEQIEHCRAWANTTVSTGQLDEWYVLLREAQGDLQAYLDCGYMSDDHDFAKDSLSCEWGYVIDFDRAVFEVYKGFQRSQPTEGRWKDTEPLRSDDPSGRVADEYFPINRIAVFNLERLPTDEDFLAQTDHQDDEED